jgi:hypothetical protein
MNPEIVWPLWIALFCFWEGAALISRRPGDTLSEKTREWFRVWTLPGRLLFGITWIVFSCWFFWHILWG